MDADTATLLMQCRDLIMRQSRLIETMFTMLREEHELAQEAVRGAQTLQQQLTLAQTQIIELGNMVLGISQDEGWQGEMGSE